MFDCIIVGSGPAGSTAAYHLAKRGRNVLIVDQASFPRSKSCGGGVSPAIAQWFDFDLSPAISLKVNKIRYTWQREDPVEVSLPDKEPMWIVQRETFDQFLMQQAQAQGAQVQTETCVTGIELTGGTWQIKTNKDPLACRYLIAADGAQGPVAKWLGFKERKLRLAANLEVAAPHASEPSLQFDFGTLKTGFIWSFPHANGYSISATTFQGKEPQNLKATLEGYAAAERLNISDSHYHESAIALWDGEHKLHSQNALLIGESASLADPLSGEGIRPSILSGVKAAEAIDSALAGNANALETYTQAIAKEWGEDMVWAGRIAGAFYKFPRIGYRVGVKRPEATRVMSQILCGQLRYGEVAGRAIKRLSSGLIPGRS